VIAHEAIRMDAEAVAATGVGQSRKEDEAILGRGEEVTSTGSAVRNVVERARSQTRFAELMPRYSRHRLLSGGWLEELRWTVRITSRRIWCSPSIELDRTRLSPSRHVPLSETPRSGRKKLRGREEVGRAHGAFMSEDGRGRPQ
jgi:hypothetical protein